MFDVRATVPNNLSAEVEPGNRLQINGYLLLGPFALKEVSQGLVCLNGKGGGAGFAHPTKLVSLDLLLLSSAETSLVHKLWQLLLHHLIDLGHGLVQALLGRAGNVEVEGGVLVLGLVASQGSHSSKRQSYRGRCHALIGIVASSGRDICHKDKKHQRSIQTQTSFKDS